MSKRLRLLKYLCLLTIYEPNLGAIWAVIGPRKSIIDLDNRSEDEVVTVMLGWQIIKQLNSADTLIGWLK